MCRVRHSERFTTLMWVERRAASEQKQEKELQDQSASIFSNQTPAYYGDQDDSDAALLDAEKAQEAEGASGSSPSVCLSGETVLIYHLQQGGMTSGLAFSALSMRLTIHQRRPCLPPNGSSCLYPRHPLPSLPAVHKARQMHLTKRRERSAKLPQTEKGRMPSARKAQVVMQMAQQPRMATAFIPCSRWATLLGRRCLRSTISRTLSYKGKRVSRLSIYAKDRADHHPVLQRSCYKNTSNTVEVARVKRRVVCLLLLHLSVFVQTIVCYLRRRPPFDCIRIFFLILFARLNANTLLPVLVFICCGPFWRNLDLVEMPFC